MHLYIHIHNVANKYTTMHITLFIVGKLKTSTNTLKSYPAKNINKNHDPGTANSRIASSEFLSCINRHGMHAKIKKFDTRKMALAGACV